MIYVNSVTVSPKCLIIDEHEWGYLSASVSPSNATNKNLVWSSSDPEVASVNSSSGAVYGISDGLATIYATATDGSGKRDSCCVEVIKV